MLIIHKEKAQLAEDKFQLEIQLNSSLAKNDSLKQQISQIEFDFVELKTKITNYEKALENVKIYLDLI